MFSLLFSDPWSLTEARDWVRQVEPRLSVDEAFQQVQKLSTIGGLDWAGFPTSYHQGELEGSLAMAIERAMAPPSRRNIPPSERPSLFLNDDGHLYDDAGVLIWSYPQVDGFRLIPLRPQISLPVNEAVANDDVEPPPQAVDVAKPGQGSPRAGYRGDLADFMTRKGLEWCKRTSDQDIVRNYFTNHTNRAKAGKEVPELPDPSNRLSRVAKQVNPIRCRMVAQQRKSAAT
jgi:hypothetical protein